MLIIVLWSTSAQGQQQRQSLPVAIGEYCNHSIQTTDASRRTLDQLRQFLSYGSLKGFGITVHLDSVLAAKPNEIKSSLLYETASQTSVDAPGYKYSGAKVVAIPNGPVIGPTRQSHRIPAEFLSPFLYFRPWVMDWSNSYAAAILDPSPSDKETAIRIFYTNKSPLSEQASTKVYIDEVAISNNLEVASVTTSIATCQNVAPTHERTFKYLIYNTIDGIHMPTKIEEDIGHRIYKTHYVTSLHIDSEIN